MNKGAKKPKMFCLFSILSISTDGWEVGERKGFRGCALCSGKNCSSFDLKTVAVLDRKL